MMDRRILVFAGVSTAMLVPIPAPAQQSPPRLYRIGFLRVVSPEVDAANMHAFHKGLAQLGFAKGRDYVTEERSAMGSPDRLRGLADDLVKLNADVIVTRGTPAAQAAKAASSTIPIVMAASGGPVETGLVQSLARPGGNVTGLSAFTTRVSAKRLELARELVPSLSRIGFVNNFSNPVSQGQFEETKRAALTLGIEAVFLDVRNVADIEQMFAKVGDRQLGALMIANDAVNFANRDLLVRLAAVMKLPVIFASREFVDAGGLMSYGVSYPHLYFRAADFVHKILRGAKPADLPVEQPTQLELVVNLKTAKALGLTIPPAILIRASEVIE